MIEKSLLLLAIILVRSCQCNVTENLFGPCEEQELIGQEVSNDIVSGNLECAALCARMSCDIFVMSRKSEKKLACFTYTKRMHPCALKVLQRDNKDNCFKRIIADGEDLQLPRRFGDQLVCVNQAGLGWDAAKADCESYNTYLVKITSQEKQDFITSWIIELADNGGLNQHQLFVGGYWDNSEWMWVPGISVTQQGYQNFETSTTDEPAPGFRCLALNFNDLDNTCTWTHYRCLMARPYFCEKTLF